VGKLVYREVNCFAQIIDNLVNQHSVLVILGKTLGGQRL
jgi:hypothetical protein